RVDRADRAEDRLQLVEPVDLRRAVGRGERLREQLRIERDRELAEPLDPLPQLLQVPLLLRARERDAVRALVEAVDEHVRVPPLPLRVHVVVAGPDADELVDEVLRALRVRGRELLDVRERGRLLADLEEELRERRLELAPERLRDEREPRVARADVEQLAG